MLLQHLLYKNSQGDMCRRVKRSTTLAYHNEHSSIQFFPSVSSFKSRMYVPWALRSWIKSSVVFSFANILLSVVNDSISLNGLLTCVESSHQKQILRIVFFHLSRLIVKQTIGMIGDHFLMYQKLADLVELLNVLL